MQRHQIKLHLLTLLSLSFFIPFSLSSQTLAITTFECHQDPPHSETNTITLTYNDELHQITWWDHAHSEFRIAPYFGIEKNTESSERGFWIFFSESEEHQTHWGHFYWVEPQFQSKTQFRVLEVFRDDGEPDLANQFHCSPF